MSLNRRSILKALGMAPAAVHVAAEQAKAAMLTGGLGHRDVFVQKVQSAALAPDNALTFTSFAKWFREFGLDRAREEAEHVAGLDPDIIDMRLPMTTKVRMQRDRQYVRAKRRLERDFASRVARYGEFRWFA